MKKAPTRTRKSIDFSKGVRGKYAGMKLVIVGATPDAGPSVSNQKDVGEVLDEVRGVLTSAGPRKRDLEVAIGRARELIDSVRHA
jgi:hypothetical protein